MAEEKVVVEVVLKEEPGASVRRQIETAGLDPSSARPAGGGRGSGGFPARAGDVTPATEEQQSKKASGSRRDYDIDTERDFNLRQLVGQSQRESTRIEKERDVNLRLGATASAARERAGSIAFLSGLRAGDRRERRQAGKIDVERDQILRERAGQTGIRGIIGSAGRSAAASGAAAAAQTLLPGRLGNVAASGAATAAAKAVSGLAAGGIAGGAAIALGIGAAAAAVALGGLAAAVTVATVAFREIEELGRVNAEIARAQALRGLRTTLGRIRRGRLIGAEAADFIGARSEFNQAFLDLGAQLLRVALPALTSIAEAGTNILRLLEPIAEAIANIVEFMVESDFARILAALVAPKTVALIALLKIAVQVFLDEKEEKRNKQVADAWEGIFDFFDVDKFLGNLPVGIVGV